MAKKIDQDEIGTRQPYEYRFVVKKLEHWSRLYETGNLQDVHTLSCEARAILERKHRDAAHRLAVNNTIAMAVMRQRSLSMKGNAKEDPIPKSAKKLFKFYNADIRRLAEFSKLEIRKATNARRPIKWRTLGMLAKMNSRSERKKLFDKLVAGDLSHGELIKRMKVPSRKIQGSRDLIPGKVISSISGALVKANEQMAVVQSEEFAARLGSVSKRRLDEFEASIDRLISQLDEIHVVIHPVKQTLKKAKRTSQSRPR